MNNCPRGQLEVQQRLQVNKLRNAHVQFLLPFKECRATGIESGYLTWEPLCRDTCVRVRFAHGNFDRYSMTTAVERHVITRHDCTTGEALSECTGTDNVVQTAPILTMVTTSMPQIIPQIENGNNIPAYALGSWKSKLQL